MSQRCVGASFLHSATRYERPWACAQRGPPWALSAPGVRNGHQVWPGHPGASFAQSFCVDLTSTGSAGPPSSGTRVRASCRPGLSQGQSCARGHPETSLAPKGGGATGIQWAMCDAQDRPPNQGRSPRSTEQKWGKWGTHWQVGETSAGTAGSAPFRWPSSWSQRPPSTQG